RAALALAPNQRVDRGGAGADALLVPWGPAVEPADFEPRAHRQPAVDGDRPDRLMREHEARAEAEHEPLDDLLENVAVGAEPVQPDDREQRFVAAPRSFDAIQHFYSLSVIPFRGVANLHIRCILCASLFIATVSPSMPSAPAHQHERRRAIARLLKE